MGYAGVFLIILLILFVVARIGGLALQFTGMEPEAARFQALSALTGTGFTTAEAERVVKNRTRRKIISVLIILGSAGLVALIGTLVVSFTQKAGAGYGWFFLRLGVIVVGVYVLHLLILKSRIVTRFLQWLSKPLMRRMLKGAPDSEELYAVGKEWEVSHMMVKQHSKHIGVPLLDVIGDEDIKILAIERSGASIPLPSIDEKLREGDGLLVFGTRSAIMRLVK